MTPARFERATPRLGIWCSILLSYGVDHPAAPLTTAAAAVQSVSCGGEGALRASLTGMGLSGYPWQRCLAALLLVPLGFGASRALAEVPGCFEAPTGEAVVVADAIDGDTVRLVDGRIVRLAGIEAPKRPLSAPPKAPWPLADAAMAALSSRVSSRSVFLYLSGGDPDRHGRHHGRLAIGAQSGWVERELLAAGWARARPFPGETGCFPELLAAETAARKAALGLWASPEFAVRSSDDPSLPSRNGLYELVEGRVVSVGRGAYMTFLDFGANVRRDFTVMLTPALVSAMEESGLSPDSLAGRRVRVRGIIEESGGPAIRLVEPAELEVID